MIKNKKQMFLVISVFSLILFLGGTTYAWFNYRSETSEQELIAGEIYLHLNEGQEEIEMTNVFPETKEEARVRDDNYITFEMTGKNTSTKTIFYEFILDHGTDKVSPKTRYRDEDLRFDLVELDSNGDEVRYLLNAVSYDTLINKRIYVDTVDAETDTEIERHYKLRMWLDENVIISDTDLNATYSTTDYKNKYATIKLIVAGDFNEKYFGYQKVLKAIEAKQNAPSNSCNPTWTDTEDGVIYFSGTNNCVDMNYVWYSGKLWRITAIYPDGAMKLVTQNNITSISFNELNQIDFYIDANTTSYMYQWLNEDFYDTLYNANQIIDKDKNWNASPRINSSVNSRLLSTKIVSSNVGLLNSYEYYNSYRCVSNSSCEGFSHTSGFLVNGYNWWLLNPDNSTQMAYVSNSVSSYSLTYNSNGVRPSIIIKPGIEFIGDGTQSSPYRIVGDKDVGLTNELINTRLSGEYIKLSNGTTNQLFRIIGVEDNKTKIIAMDYADNGNTHQFSTNSSVADTLWGSGATTGADTWYTYLNTPTTGYFDTIKSTYGELFDTGLYYLGSTEHNYKLGVCANATSGNIKVCDKTNAKGIFNIGLPRYGEMFATQQSGGNSSSIGMWLINRNSGIFVWVVHVSGTIDYSNSTVTFGARPTVHLKSTVKIISGSGTETDPYVVGL